MGDPLLIVNLKSYPGALGVGAVTIGQALQDLGREAGVSVAIAPAPTEVAHLAHALAIPVLAQHVDPIDAGARTGFVAPEALVHAHARGSLVNHSEHPISDADIHSVIVRLQQFQLVPVVCANAADTAGRLARYLPPYLAVEPPELIGGDRAVSTARPEVISNTVAAVRSVSPTTRVLCGAGVHTRVDVARAIELGSRGILVASAVTRASDPAAAIRELLQGF